MVLLAAILYTFYALSCKLQLVSTYFNQTTFGQHTFDQHTFDQQTYSQQTFSQQTFDERIFRFRPKHQEGSQSLRTWA